jgi:hypothetical protein
VVYHTKVILEISICSTYIALPETSICATYIAAHYREFYSGLGHGIGGSCWPANLDCSIQIKESERLSNKMTNPFSIEDAHTSHTAFKLVHNYTCIMHVHPPHARILFALVVCCLAPKCFRQYHQFTIILFQQVQIAAQKVG